MTWNNYGVESTKWNLDHIISLKYAIDNGIDLKLTLHYLNLTPMWSILNIQKSKTLTVDLELHLNKIKEALASTSVPS